MPAIAACAHTGAASAPAPATAVVTESADTTAREVSALLEAAKGSRGAFDVVASLTDEVGPRMAGSSGDKAAVAWAQKTMAGLHLTHVKAEPVTVDVWVRGEESGSIVSPVTQRLAVVALGGSVGARDLEADVIEMPTLDALRAADPKAVAGKIVFLSAAMPRSKNGKGYGMTVPIRAQGAAIAAGLGAVGVIIRSVGTDHDRLPHTGYMHAAPIPAASVSVPDAEMLERMLASGRPVRVRLSLGAHAEGQASSANVIGEIVGSERPGEVVVVGAHLDSWDLARGAIDDGAGCGIVLEAARLITGRRAPRRTVRFVLFANEEQGIVGARAYAKAHAIEATHTIAAIEADEGTGRAYALRVTGGPNAARSLAAAAVSLEALGIMMDPAEGARGGSDISPLRQAGVPVLDLPQDMTTSFDIHHSANDTLDKVDPDALEQVASAYAAVAYILADGKIDLGRVPESKRESD